MKRGMILAAVMLLVALGALTSVGVLFRSNAEQFTVSASGRMARARAMAKSGLAGVMREFEEQRMEILRGGDPMLLDELSLEQADGRVGVVRIVRVGQALCRSESAKINVNHADEETLGRLAVVGADLAGSIVAGRPYASIDELLRVRGVTPEMLYGDLGRLLGEGDDEDARALTGQVGGQLALRDVLTVHGFWPPIQLGAGEGGASFAGEKKINLNRAWSDDLGKAIAKRYSEDVAEAVKGIMSRGTTFKGERDVIRVLQQLNIRPTDWGETLDSFCVSDEPALAGRVDIARASAEVLAALPRLDETSAAAIRSACETVDRGALMTVVWPVTSGAISGEQLAACVDSIAPSSAQWRVVIEAGFRDGGTQADEDGPLESRVVLDAVIDLSSPRARVVELTDITNLALAAAWRLEDVEDAEEASASGEDEESDTLSGVVRSVVDDEGRDVNKDSRDNSTAARSVGSSVSTTPPSSTPAPAPPAPDRRIGRFRAGGGS